MSAQKTKITHLLRSAQRSVFFFFEKSGNKKFYMWLDGGSFKAPLQFIVVFKTGN